MSTVSGIRNGNMEPDKGVLLRAMRAIVDLADNKDKARRHEPNPGSFQHKFRHHP